MSETPLCLLLLVKTLRQRDVLRLLTACAEPSMSLGSRKTDFALKLEISHIKLSVFLQSVGGFSPVFLYIFALNFAFFVCLFVCLVFMCAVLVFVLRFVLAL
jgi:hypothetical protein